MLQDSRGRQERLGRWPPQGVSRPMFTVFNILCRLYSFPFPCSIIIFVVAFVLILISSFKIDYVQSRWCTQSYNVRCLEYSNQFHAPRIQFVKLLRRRLSGIARCVFAAIRQRTRTARRPTSSTRWSPKPTRCCRAVSIQPVQRYVIVIVKEMFLLSGRFIANDICLQQMRSDLTPNNPLV